MSRLIDADKLIERLWEQHKGIQANADMYTNADEVAEEVCYLVSFIDEQPTAYDVEKVVEQLKDAGYDDGLLQEHLAIDIVKRGAE